MSVLLNAIRCEYREAADVLEKAGLRTDSDLRSLTREDLNELLPGHEKFKLRRAIFEMIHKQRPVNELIRDLKAFIPQEPLRAALTNNGVLIEYLHLLKDIKTQMDNVQDFINAHIVFLEESSKDQPDQESDKGCSTSNTFDSMPPCNDQTDYHSQGTQATGTAGMGGRVEPYTGPSGGYMKEKQGTADMGGRMEPYTAGMGGRMEPYTGPSGGYMKEKQGTSGASGSVKHYTRTTSGYFQGSQTTVTYHNIVAGQTFGAHSQLMDKVKYQCKSQVQFVESSVDHQITIVFCPITSRIGSDVEAAMSRVTDDKPVILVLMHHTYEAKPTTSVRTWSAGLEAVLHVNVFYHETVPGLLACTQNNLAVSSIHSKLLEYSTPRCQDTSGNAQGAGPVVGQEVVGSHGTNRSSYSQDSSSGSIWPFSVPSVFRSSK